MNVSNLILILFLAVGLYRCQEQLETAKVKKECTDVNCRVPLCKCSNSQIPNDIPFDDTPMMIALSFNGVLTSEHARYIKKILNPVFKNPNDCPIQATFFVSDNGIGNTDYCFVQGLFNNNNEIGVGSIEYECPYTDCDALQSEFRQWNKKEAEKKIFGEKKLLEAKAHINRSFLRGFRLPWLNQGGNAHFETLKKFAFSYDSSVIVSPNDIRKNGMLRFWPHTLDFPINYVCSTCPTEKSLCQQDHATNCSLSMNSIWIVPLHYFNVEDKHTCPTLIKSKAAQNNNETKDCWPTEKLNEKILADQLMENFERHYKTNKAPFVINLELSWFKDFGDILTEALVEFINKLTNEKEANVHSKNDVYFVSISKIIEWIEYPTPLHVIGNRWLWDCDGSNYDYDEECQSLRRLRENSIELEETKRRNHTALDLKNEDLFRSGVLTSVIVVFVVSIIFVFIYDRYK